MLRPNLHDGSVEVTCLVAGCSQVHGQPVLITEVIFCIIPFDVCCISRLYIHIACLFVITMSTESHSFKLNMLTGIVFIWCINQLRKKSLVCFCFQFAKLYNFDLLRKGTRQKCSLQTLCHSVLEILQQPLFTDMRYGVMKSTWSHLIRVWHTVITLISRVKKNFKNWFSWSGNMQLLSCCNCGNLRLTVRASPTFDERRWPA